MSRTLAACAFALLTACGSSAVTPTPSVDGGVPLVEDAGPAIVDAGVLPLPPGSISVSGSIYRLDDYLGGSHVPLAGATIKTLGVLGVPPTTADPQGRYSVIVPQNGKVVFSVEKDIHVTTYEEISLPAQPVSKSFLLASKIWVDLVAAAHSVSRVAQLPCHAPNDPTAPCKYAFVVGQLLDDGTEGNGTPTPIAGVTKDEFTIAVDGDQAWYRKGPYFLNANGTPNAGLTASVRERDPATNAYRGGLFFLFVEVPIGGPPERTLAVTVRTQAGTVERRLGPTVAKLYLQDLAWVKLYQSALGPPPVTPPPPPPPGGPDFDTAIYPLFLPVNEGGYGCQGCHTAEGGNSPSGGLNLDGDPATAYGGLDPARYPERVNVANPRESKLLTKPLYDVGGVQDHPIFAFVSDVDPGYQAIHAWIQAGGKRPGGGVDAPPPPPPVSFTTEVYPLLSTPAGSGGIGCIECHSGGNAPGGFSVDGDPTLVFQELTAEAPADDSGTGEPYRINKNGNPGQSLLLLNPLLGSPEPHPAKLLPNTADPRYQTLYAWISQGYQTDAQ
ncbi:MAG: hypothetical protein HYV07_20215 [Deltaproteobacteria bacterium]|nr:hypothetical protein [Deltaproteobacteria bacterium]